MARFGKFLSAIGADWLARMSGPITVPFTILAFVLSSTAVRVLFAILAVIAALTTCYRVWTKEYDRGEAEKSKNEAPPHIDITVLNVVPRGSIGSGLTDLFLYLDLVLGSPNRVSILNFSLMIFNDTQSSTILGVDDVFDWQLVKSTEDALRSFASCVPLLKELTRPGDPVQGWVHFPLQGGVSERFIQSSGLKIEVNCEQGTCYYNLSGAYVRVDPNKGSMRKIPTS